MSKPMTLSEKMAVADEFIARVNPYEKKEDTFSFDLRAYANYVEKNKIKPEDITTSIMMQFASTQ